MNIYSRIGKYASLALVVLFAVAPSLVAQISINGTPVGEAYPITGDGNNIITFTRDGGVVTVKAPTGLANNTPHTVTWVGPVNMIDSSSGTFEVTNNGTGEVTFVLNSVLSGTGDLIKTGNGTFLLNGNAADFTGGINIENGTFAIGNAAILSSENAVTLANGTLFDISARGNLTIASLEGSGTVKFNNAQKLTVGDGKDKIFNGILTGGNALSVLEKVGSGTLQINNDVSSFLGTIQVSEGVLGGTGVLGKVIVGDGVNKATLAPGTGADSVERIWINDLTIKEGSALQIRVNDQKDPNASWSDQVIVGSIDIKDGAVLLVDALAGDYTTPKIYNGYIVGGTPNYSHFSDLDIIQQFLIIDWWKDAFGAEDRNNGFTIGRNPTYFQTLAPNLTYNQREVAKALDKAGGGLWDAMTLISQLDPSHIPAAYNQIAGDLRANSMMLGQWQTSRYGLNHLDLTNCGYSQGGGVWLEIIHQTTDFKSDGNSGPYGISRTGFLIGSEERRVDTVYGFFVGYSYPFLYSQGDKVEAGDLQFGFYGGSKVADVLETKLFVGYGHQGYKSKRYIDNPLLVDTRERINGKYDGDSMSMSLEFAVPLSSGFFCLRPVVAIDSDLTWQYGFAESGNTGLELQYGREFMDRSFLRTGLTMQLGSVDRCDTLALLGRAYYGHQVFGESYPVSRSRFVGEEHRMMIHGVNPGKDYVDLGIGLRWNIDAHRSFYGDYDFNAFSRSNAHWGTIGFMQRW